MARTPLASWLEEAAAIAQESSQRDLPADRVIRERITDGNCFAVQRSSVSPARRR